MIHNAIFAREDSTDLHQAAILQWGIYVKKYKKKGFRGEKEHKKERRFLDSMKKQTYL